jgi:hypothetical protein
MTSHGMARTIGTSVYRLATAPATIFGGIYD